MIKGKTVLITGAGRGIGQAVAESCAAAGAKLCLTARTEKELRQTAEQLKSKYQVPVYWQCCDVAQFEQVQSFVKNSERELGPIYGVISAAGIYGPIGKLEATDPKHWAQTHQVNVLGTYYLLHEALPLLRSRREGRVILFSGGGEKAMANFSAYVSSKGAIWRLCETLAQEVLPDEIYVNAIAPGAVNTYLLDELLAAGPDKTGKEIYERSLKQKEEGGTSPQKTQDLVQYLLSERSRGLTGKVLSAVWDRYEEFKDLPTISKSDLYAMRRVVKT